MIYSPSLSSSFSAAKVFVCCLVLGPERSCRVATGEEPWRETEMASSNWWEPLIGHGSGGGEASAATIGDVFEVTASMTVSEAYQAREYVRDDVGGPGSRLITTGLIDRDQCHWGGKPCRFLGQTYAAPRLAPADALPASLARRVEKSKRPKILVAGLTRKIEAFVDADGLCIGAVSTFSIYHPADDVEALECLCRHLHSEQTHAAYLARLGAHRIGGGDITMRKAFLQGLALP
jgi:hypothetical protein